MSDDGDPLDVLVLVDAPSFAGCVMTVRTIGVLRMVDQNREDEKILAVGLNNPVFKEVTDYEQLYPHLLREIEHFFSIYKNWKLSRRRLRAGETRPAPAKS